MAKPPRAETHAEETAASADVGTVSDVGLAVTVQARTPEQSAPPTDPAPPARFTPHQLATLTGNVTPAKQAIAFGKDGKGASQAPPKPAYSWQHAAAAQLHGWGLHEHHAGKPIELSREAYEHALAAASEPVTRPNPPGPPMTVYKPHPAALSPHAPKEG